MAEPHGSSHDRETDIPADGRGKPALQEVRFEYTPALPQILAHIGAALLVSTYQAGKLVVLGVQQGQLTVDVQNFERPMGVAVAPHAIAVGTRRQMHFLRPAHELASTLNRNGSYDRCWIPQCSWHTANIHGHDLAWGQDGLWVVNTLFSCLCTLHEDYNFVPRWRPKFVSQLIDQDRCHLNGLALKNGLPKYVTLMAESDEPGGWRATKATSGCVVDVPSGETVARGFSMPHSPRLHDGKLWVLDSGKGCLGVVDPATGQTQTVVQLPGYTRGLAFCGQFAFVGLSRIRETSVFGGIPIAEHRDELRCGIAVVDLISGQAVARFEFHNGVEEVFAVEVLPNTRNPAVYGPSSDEDRQSEVWIVPHPGRIPAPYEGRNVFAVAHAEFSNFTRGGGTPYRGSDGPPSENTLTNAQLSEREDAHALMAKGTALHSQGRLEEAVSVLTRATQIAADPAPSLTNLGNVFQDLGQQERALECYNDAVRHTPNCIAAQQNLGYLLFNNGEPRLALEHYEQALRFAPTPLNRLLAASVLPVVYESVDDVAYWRTRMETQIQQLVDENVTIDTMRHMVPTSFFIAYQGRNDRQLMSNLGCIFSGEDGVTNGRAIMRSKRLRVGFLSAYFRDHTIGRLNLGRIQHLSRNDFEVSVISASRRTDSVVEQFRTAADQYVQLSRDVAEARRRIGSLHLDVLIFADVGMDALTSTLAFSRMAPVQCATWGHPDTTGSRCMDYFLSSELLEIPGADAHYSEKLVRLRNLATHFERPGRTGPPRTREFFGLKGNRNLYLCPQTLFKFHPDFDPLLAQILETDPLADLVFLEGRVPNWTRRLRARFETTLPDARHRVHFLPAQPRDDFLALLEAADVILDPLHFGGGHTSYEALALGIPVVTLPGEFLRSRITQALYRRMNLPTLTVNNREEFVQLATQIGTKPDARNEFSNQIATRNEILFENIDDIRALEEFLNSLRESDTFR